MYEPPRVATASAPSERLQTAEGRCLTALEVGRPRFRCQQGLAPSNTSRERLPPLSVTAAGLLVGFLGSLEQPRQPSIFPWRPGVRLHRAVKVSRPCAPNQSPPCTPSSSTPSPRKGTFCHLEVRISAYLLGGCWGGPQFHPQQTSEVHRRTRSHAGKQPREN